MPASLNFGPKLRRWAYRPLAEDPQLNILVGAVRSGKTTATFPKIINGCKYPVDGWRLITGASKQSIYNNVLNGLFNLIGPNSYHYNNQSGLLRIGTAMWRVMGAHDEGSDKYIRGMTVGLAVCDELTLMPLDFFQMLRTRMSPAGARLYGTTNCDTPRHWLKEKYIDNQELYRDRLLDVTTVTMEDNPNLTEEFKRSQRAAYTGLFYERFILGHWVMAEGAIYRDCFTDDCLYDDSTAPIGLHNAGGSQDRWISIDVGVDHPQVYLEFLDDGETIWVAKEYFWDSRAEMRQKTDGQYADDLEKFMGERCEIRIPPEAASFKAELLLRSHWVVNANNEVTEGISTVASLFAKRKLRIHRKCTNLRRSVELYAWDPKAALRGIEQPLKIDDDPADALRYGVHKKIPNYRFASI